MCKEHSEVIELERPFRRILSRLLSPSDSTSPSTSITTSSSASLKAKVLLPFAHSSCQLSCLYSWPQVFPPACSQLMFLCLLISLSQPCGLLFVPCASSCIHLCPVLLLPPDFSSSCSIHDALREFLVLPAPALIPLNTDVLCRTKQPQFLPLNTPKYCYSSCMPFRHLVFSRSPFDAGGARCITQHQARHRCLLSMETHSAVLDGQNPTFPTPSIV